MSSSKIGGDLAEDERSMIDSTLAATGRSYDEVLEGDRRLAGLSACARLVISPKTDPSLRHIEFVPLTAGRALVVLVNELGLVENRLSAAGVPASVLVQATNFLNNRFYGASIVWRCETSRPILSSAGANWTS